MRSTKTGRREHSGRNACAVGYMSGPLTGVVALLIDPACCYRTAPCPPPLGEGMTGSRNSPALPQSTCTPSQLEKAPQPTPAPRAADLPASAEVCIGTGQGQDRSSSLRCGRFVLTPALTRCRLHGGRKPAKSLVTNVLTEPHPFRDDILRATTVPVPGRHFRAGDARHSAWEAEGTVRRRSVSAVSPCGERRGALVGLPACALPREKTPFDPLGDGGGLPGGDTASPFNSPGLCGCAPSLTSPRIPAARRRLWGLLARCTGCVSMGAGAAELNCPPARPDHPGSSGTTGAGPTGRR